MLVIAALVTVALAAPLQGPPTDPRVRALHDLSKKAQQPLERETVALIEKGLSSGSEPVRRAALETIHALAFIGHRTKGRSSPEAWTAEKTQLLALKPRIIAALSDADERTRDSAVLALGTLDSVTGPRGQMITNVDTMNRFARMLPNEPSVRVRVQIVKTFALLADKRAEVPTERVLVDALDDPAPPVVHFGAAGIGNAGLVKHLPHLVPLLRHPNRGVSQAAAGTFNKLAADAFPFIPDLQRAADAAPDGPFKQTLLAAIRQAREKARK